MDLLIERLTVGRMFEAINGTLFLLDIFILLVFSTYLYGQISGARKAGLVDSARTSIAYAMRELKGALSLLVFFIGATIARGVVWLWRYLLNEGWTPSGAWSDAQLGVLTAGVVICCVGAFCILRVFSDRAYRKPIMTGAAITVALATAFAFLH